MSVPRAADNGVGTANSEITNPTGAAAVVERPDAKLHEATEPGTGPFSRPAFRLAPNLGVDRGSLAGYCLEIGETKDVVSDCSEDSEIYRANPQNLRVL
jgi:hypothetical protein